MKLSLGRLTAVLGLLFLMVAVALGLLMAGLFQLGIDAQVGHVRARVESSCVLVAQRFKVYLDSYLQQPHSFDDAQRQHELTLVLGLALAEHAGVEGGFWSEKEGFVAYAYPTYQGETAKKDVPEAEKGRLLKVLRAAAAGQTETRSFDGATESLVISARPALKDGLLVWTMARAHVESASAHQKLMMGFAALSVFALVAGATLLWFMRRWSHRASALVNSMDVAQGAEFPELNETGVQELDLLVAALNRMNTRLQESRRELVRAERMATLGRMAANVAHEVRNPVAAIRLRAENALAKTDTHRTAALEFTLQEIRRLDALLERLLAMTRLEGVHPALVRLHPWMHGRLEALQDEARSLGVELTGETAVEEARLDEHAMARALDNLLHNALQHTPAGGWVRLMVRPHEGRGLLLAVEDSGPGVPEAEREKIFEPFVTTRADGTGLGLNIARQIVEAHGGTLRCISGGSGARFEITLP